MALSFVQYTGDGQTRVFNVTFQYLKQENVYVYVDGTPVNFSWLDTARVELTTTPLLGQTVEIRRISDRAAREVNFQDGSVLNEAALDADSDQLFELTQEAFDAADAAVSLQPDGTMSAKGKRISNILEPVNPQDAVTKQWATTAMDSELHQAIAAKTAAQNANANAELAEDAANQHKLDAGSHSANASIFSDEADAARIAAQTARTGAELAEDGAQLAQGHAETAQGHAETAQAAAELAKSGADTAKAGADLAKSGADSAKTAAETAKAGAETAKTAAETAQTGAETAQTGAQTARTGAETAKAGADTAKTGADAAKAAAITAQTAAETAQSGSILAKTGAETAKAGAETARTGAETAQAAAEVAEANAATSATAAATSLSNLQSSETNAAASALAAQQSAAAAAASYDSFDDRYLGVKTVEPTTDNDGDPLTKGLLYFQSGSGMKVYDGAAWVSASASGIASMRTHEFTATQGQTVVSGNDLNGVGLSYLQDNVIVLVNGIGMRSGDITATDGSSITFTDPLDLNDEVTVIAFKSFVVADHYNKTETDNLLAGKADNHNHPYASDNHNHDTQYAPIHGHPYASDTHNHDSVYLKPNGDGSQLTGINTNPNDKAIGSTGFFDLPSGTTAQRPSNPSEGYVRLNTTEDKLEMYQGGAWKTYSPDQPLTITGGTVSQSGGYTYHTFTSSGNFTIAGGSGSVQLEYMIVAGGGGGGIGYETANAGDGAGGGGAGGMIVENAAVPNGSYTITIGAGGSHQNQGGNTLALGKTAIGGGKGGTDVNGNSGSQAHGGAGGSGGGAASDWDGGGRSGGSGTGGQGHNGGSTNGASGWRIGAGGGGRGGAGASDEGRGFGGIGYTWVNGTTYAGGGGGGTSSNGGEVGNNGGAGGGGRGGSYGGGFGGQAGTVNTGGGGGGDSSGGYTQYGGSGGSGIVIIRYPTPS